jgi:predicted kinase
MEVEIDYYAATKTKLQAGVIESPPNLTVTFVWEDEPEDSEEIHIFIGQDVEVGLSSVTSRLIHVDGLVSDLGAWSLVPEVIGPDLWQMAVRVVEKRQSQTMSHYVDAAQFEHLWPAWRQLAEAGKSGKIANMRSGSEYGREVLRILASEPGLLEKVFDSFEEQLQERDKT